MLAAALVSILFSAVPAQAAAVRFPPTLRLPSAPTVAISPSLSAPAASTALSASPVLAAPLLASPQVAPSVEDTDGLKVHQQAVRHGEAGALPVEARLVRYLFVPGFSWDAVPDYFEPNVARLRTLGLDAELLKTDPLATAKENGRLIRAAIERSDKPVVLIGHSKGGSDALDVLQAHPELQKKVTRLVALQSPYLGTAVADWFLARPWLYTTAMAYARLLNPKRLLATNPFFRHDTVRELSREVRQALAGKLPDLDPALKVFSVASRVSDKTTIKLLLWITAGTIKALTGRHNDGIVVPEDAVVPGSRYAILDHVGHIDTISSPDHWRHKILGVRGHDPHFAADLTEAIVRWIFAARKNQ